MTTKRKEIEQTRADALVFIHNHADQSETEKVKDAQNIVMNCDYILRLYNCLGIEV